MDDEMEDMEEQGFWPFEIDFEYEYDAYKYFDFVNEESVEEAREAELWFATATSYPPSPYVAQLNAREAMLSESTSTYQSSNGLDMDTDQSVDDVAPEKTDPGECEEDCRIYNQVGDKPKGKSIVKVPFSRGSTLMKPTASQLAKQNHPLGVKSSTQSAQRFDKALSQKAERILEHRPINEIQAAKRQKLEGGHLRKVLGTQQPTNLMHKVPKKVAPLDSCFQKPILKLTIPREPELVTAQRAQRIRHKNGTEVGTNEATTLPLFKARPLNRKIFEAPSQPLFQKHGPRMPEFQEFHLKTFERALKHLPASSSHTPKKCPEDVAHKHMTISGIQTVVTYSKKLQKHQNRDELKQDQVRHVFKARPLDKKIFTSKGDMGVFRTVKRETTTPLAFNFSTDKRCQQNPPIELFSKLSLATEVPQSTESPAELPWHPQKPVKGSKENRTNFVRQESKVTFMSKGMLQRLKEKQDLHGGGAGLTEVKSRENMCTKTWT